MNNVTPAYLYPSVLFSAIAVVAACLLGLRRALTRLEPRLRDRYAFRSVPVLFLAWFLAALGSAWYGFYSGASSRIPTIQYGLFIPIAAGMLLYWRWTALKLFIERTPQSWMVAIQVYRAMGVLFLILYAGGRLPGEFALPAGVGDVIVGVAAPLIALAYARGKSGSAGLLRAWNLLGLADLVIAVATGLLTSPSPLQLLALGRPNLLISSFPLVLIPVFLVPLAVLLHLASLQKLRATRPATALHTNRLSPHRAPDPQCSQP